MFVVGLNVVFGGGFSGQGFFVGSACYFGPKEVVSPCSAQGFIVGVIPLQGKPLVFYFGCRLTFFSILALCWRGFPPLCWFGFYLT